MGVNLTVYGQTDVGRVRRTNEDAFVVADLTGNGVLQEQRITRFEVGQRGVLLAVSDGMGGHQAGEVASALVVESLRRSMAQRFDAEDQPPDALLEQATKRANRDVWQAAHYPGRQGMGATLTAVFIRGLLRTSPRWATRGRTCCAAASSSRSRATRATCSSWSNAAR